MKTKQTVDKLWRELQDTLHKAYQDNPTNMSTPVLYLLEDGEAYCVRYFCSTQCRARFASHESGRAANGTNDDWVDGTACDECNTKLGGSHEHD